MIAELRRLSDRHCDMTNQSTLHLITLSHLTYREMEVLRLMAQGKNNRMISHDLEISEKTVNNHVSHIMSHIIRKLQVQDRTQAVLYAIRSGWIHFY